MTDETVGLRWNATELASDDLVTRTDETDELLELTAG
jgi:hypothetical protein